MYRFESWRIVLNFIPISQGSTKQSESTRSSLDPAGIAASRSGILSLQSPGIKTTSALGAIRLTRTFNDSMDTESFSQKMDLSKGCGSGSARRGEPATILRVSRILL